jgi:hypothetical protein
MLKYLRIAVTALSLTACMLLVALWVRSYWRHDFVISGIFRDKREFDLYSGNGWLGLSVFDYGPGLAFYEQSIASQMLLQLPYWQVVAVDLMLALGPWIPKRLSLREFLVAVTLVAISLGIIANYWPYYFPHGIAFSWSHLLRCFR